MFCRTDQNLRTLDQQIIPLELGASVLRKDVGLVQNPSIRDIVLGKIMKMGNTFACFMTKKNCIFTSSSNSGIQKYFFYLEFHFTVKTKLVNNFVIFLMIIFQFFFIKI
jgi:hypothetical protein